MTDIAEGTAAGTDITHDHKRRRAATKALAEVGAVGFFAHRRELVFTQNGLDAIHFRRRGDAYPNPVWFARQLIAITGNYLDRNTLYFRGIAQFFALFITLTAFYRLQFRHDRNWRQIRHKKLVLKLVKFRRQRLSGLQWRL